MNFSKTVSEVITSSFWDNLFVGSLLLAIPLFTAQLFKTGYFWDERYSDILKNIALLKLVIVIIKPWFLEYGKFNPSEAIKITVWIAIFIFILKYSFYEFCDLANKWSFMN